MPCYYAWLCYTHTNANTSQLMWVMICNLWWRKTKYCWINIIVHKHGSGLLLISSLQKNPSYALKEKTERDCFDSFHKYMKTDCWKTPVVIHSSIVAMIRRKQWKTTAAFLIEKKPHKTSHMSIKSTALFFFFNSSSEITKVAIKQSRKQRKNNVYIFHWRDQLNNRSFQLTMPHLLSTVSCQLLPTHCRTDITEK